MGVKINSFKGALLQKVENSDMRKRKVSYFYGNQPKISRP